MSVPNRLLGRVFAAELALMTLTSSISNYTVGVAADAGWSPRALALGIAGVFVLPGVVLLLLLWPRPDVEAGRSADQEIGDLRLEMRD
jgi:hypothetical protein